MAPARARGLAWVAWLAALALATVGMFAVRGQLDKAHVALVYLLLVLGGTALGGRAIGLTLAFLAFGGFNYFFLPPYHTFAVAAPLDLLILGAFLVTSAVAAQLLARAQTEAEEARRRADEIDRLSALGAETLNAARAEDALDAIADVIRSTLEVARCEIYLRDAARGVALVAARGDAPPTAAGARASGGAGEPLDLPRAHGLPTAERLVEWVAVSGRPASERTDGTVRVMAEDAGAATLALADARSLLLPLTVRARTVGVLRLEHSGVFAPDAASLRFLEALSYYAALGVERVRLAAEAERAEALRRADEMKNALLASVSHDLRTPLTTIKALAHDIGAEGDARAETIEHEADRLNRFVADLLDLSKLAAGGLALAPEITAADDLVGAALRSVSGAQGARAIDVALEETDELLLGRFDFVHSLRALVNLLENALKYAPPAEPVELTVRRAGPTLEFAVADRGPGVPPAERERIFEPFYRPPGSPPDVGGAGLGLSIARRLAEAQGGKVAYEPRDGGGSRFVLQLPAAEVTSSFATTE